MFNKSKKDALYRVKHRSLEYLRQLYKSIIKNQALAQEIRYEFVLKLNALPKASSRVKQRNRCALSGRSRGVLRTFKMSRICLRELAAQGALLGVTKSSW